MNRHFSFYVLVLLTVSFLQGCGKTMLYKDSATVADFDRDMQVCKYDATKYGYVNSSYTGGGYGSAVGAGMADGLAQAIREREIIMQCMALRGWSTKKSDNSYAE